MRQTQGKQLMTSDEICIELHMHSNGLMFRMFRTILYTTLLIPNTVAVSNVIFHVGARLYLCSELCVDYLASD